MGRNIHEYQSYQGIEFGPCADFGGAREDKGGRKPVRWNNAPHALTEIRNSLVHPEHKRRRQFDTVYYEAWNLGLWYLAMVLLAVCEYSGTYRNRLKKRYVGQVEKVSWG